MVSQGFAGAAASRRAVLRSWGRLREVLSRIADLNVNRIDAFLPGWYGQKHRDKALGGRSQE